MKSITTTSPAVSVTDETPNLQAVLADLRRRSRALTPAIQKAADDYWQLVDEQSALDRETADIEEYIEDLESMVKFRGGETGEGKQAKRRHKKFDRLATCQHRSNGLASMSDASHVKLVIKARRKARRDRECDKPTSQIRAARLRKQDHREETLNVLFHLTPVEIEFFAKKAEETRRSKEGKRAKLLATLTDPARISVLLNGDLHE